MRNDLVQATAESRARCGLPPKVEDAAVLRRLAALFGPERDEERPVGRSYALTTTTALAKGTGGRRVPR